MKPLKERIEEKTIPLKRVVENAKTNRLVSIPQSNPLFFSQFDDRDPNPPFGQFGNTQPPWGKA